MSIREEIKPSIVALCLVEGISQSELVRQLKIKPVEINIAIYRKHLGLHCRCFRVTTILPYHQDGIVKLDSLPDLSTMYWMIMMFSKSKLYLRAECLLAPINNILFLNELIKLHIWHTSILLILNITQLRCMAVRAICSGQFWKLKQYLALVQPCMESGGQGSLSMKYYSGRRVSLVQMYLIRYDEIPTSYLMCQFC